MYFRKNGMMEWKNEANIFPREEKSSAVLV